MPKKQTKLQQNIARHKISIVLLHAISNPNGVKEPE
jgi:hypothetical protein